MTVALVFVLSGEHTLVALVLVALQYVSAQLPQHSQEQVGRMP